MDAAVTLMVSAALATGSLAVVGGAPAHAAATAIVTPLAHVATAVAAADVDGDGRLDLVAAEQVGGFLDTDVVVLRGDGLGGFVPGAPSAAQLNPTWVAVGRLDDDRLPDVAVSSTRAAGVAFGSPGGGFRRTRSLGGAGGRDAVIGDFNGDGDGDVAASGRVSLGDGRGGFTPAGSYGTAGPSGLRFTVGDFDRDMKQDLAYVDEFSSPGAAVQRGRGDGTFDPPQALAAPGRLAIASADLDGDLDQDILVFSAGAGTATALLSDGEEGFVAGDPVPISGAGNPAHAAVADLNGDGALDMAISMIQAGFGALSIRYGDGRGGFPAEDVTDFPADMPGSLTVGDFTRDGRCDLAVAFLDPAEIRVYPGEGRPAPAETDPCRDRIRDPAGPMGGRVLTPTATVAPGAAVAVSMSLSRPAVVGGSFARSFARTVPRRHRVARAGRRTFRFRAPRKAGRYILTISAGSLEGTIIRRGMRVVVRPKASRRG